MLDHHIQSELTNATWHFNAKRYTDAELIYKGILQRIPMQPDALFMLGAIAEIVGQPQKAVWFGQGAVNSCPNRAEFWNGLGAWHRQNGEIALAVYAFQRAVELAPAIAEYHSNLIFTAHYLYNFDEVTSECLRWESAHGQVKRCQHQERKPGKIRIGYVSHDLGMHSVSFFLLPLLRNHDRSRFHITCFAGPQDDDVTKRLKDKVDEWLVIEGVPDKAVSRLIRNKGIDILVDLSGHTAHNRLTLFAHKPAPVQVSWLGFPGPTGLSAIDFRITDHAADPLPGGSENLIRLPSTAWCFEPLSGSPPVATLPAIANGYVTFGCLSHISKISPLCMEMWALILNLCPNSRLILKSSSFRSSEVMLRFKNWFFDLGIDGDRIDFLPDTKEPLDHILTYNHIDIALDTFPYTGTTTTCEALWMGVPVVSLCGQHHISRVGHSLLNSLGAGGLSVATAEEYVATAVDLASDVERLAGARADLRQQMQSSAIMDGAAFARGVEAAMMDAIRILDDRTGCITRPSS